ncbi:S1 RNA-binding domain-containing protein [Niallia nealsonii AAU1]|nr:S1 RNA-binding domain-containing protein [Niallia nealsonii AAU1]
MEKVLEQQKGQDYLSIIAKEQNVSMKQVKSVITLIEDGNTVPFIARYRKEQTGALDEVQIKDIIDRYTYIQNLAQRKEEVIRLIEEQGKLTEELRKNITKAIKLQEVEDLYRPYKQKRRTKATIAKEKGLEPFAEWLLNRNQENSLEEEARKYISEEKDVLTIEDAINGAKDILAERISDDAESRKWIRNKTMLSGKIQSSSKNAEKDEKNIYEMYYEYEEPVNKIVPHRTLALNRGEKEDILKVAIIAPVDVIIEYLEEKWITNTRSPAASIIKEALEDGFKRLIQLLSKEK